MSHTIYRVPPVHRRAGRRGLAALLTTTLVAAGAVLAVSTPAEAATHEVTGQVFRDFNSNGARDTNAASSGVASDVGLGGVTVTATDGKNTKVGTATTNADGTYSLSVVDPSSNDVRIDFSEPAGYRSSFHGGDSGTSVQFVTVGDQPVTDVDFAVNAPEDYSQDVASPLVTAVHSAGNRNDPANAGKPSLVSVPWSATRNDNPAAGDYSQRTTLAVVKDTGSLWGEAFQKSTGDLFAAASLRRHADLGPLGLGGIYRVADALRPDGTINPDAGEVTQWLDVDDLPGVDLGTVPSIDERGITEPDQPAHDTEVYGKVGKAGIGGIAVSSDGKKLYFVNLFDKKIYIVNIDDKTLAGTVDLNLKEGERPWAISVHRGKVYAGFVETGEDDAAALDMVVRAAPESSLDSLGSSTGEVLRSSLGYTRGSVYGNLDLTSPFRKWHAWTDVWDEEAYTFSSWGRSWAQPILSDLQFTTQGDLVIGLQDRFGLQFGNRNYGPGSEDTTLTQGVTVGDILIASPEDDGSFALEDDGTVGGRETTTGRANEGPGGREFFNDSNIYQNPAGHHETALGGLTTMAGIDQVAATAFDPTNQLRTSGITWFSTLNGSVAKGYQQSADGGDSDTNTSGNFQKAGGLGDVQALANQAPLEIGNRVWFDADNDGVQDADEPAIDGVKVELFAAGPDGKPTGSVLKTETTKDGGQYYFSVDPDTKYVVVFTPPTSGSWVSGDPRFGTIPWTDMTFTKNTPADTTIDSNADANGHAPVETGGPGENDHTIDAGLVIVPKVEITKGDGDAKAGTIKHEADTVTDGEFYKPGESRDIVIKVNNPGPEALRKVELTDATRSGANIANLKWTFPDGSTVAATWDPTTSTWSARWDETFAPNTAAWKVGDVITGTATLKANAADKPHQNLVKVNAEGAASGTPVEDENPYNEFTAAIQVIKYDGNKADPAIKDANGTWITPAKPLVDAGQDANDKDHSVSYGADQANKVRWVVTNTGPTWLTNITLADVTGAGPSIGADWTANLSEFGGPAGYSFVKDGPWKGRIPPGASFYARGTLTLPADTVHQDTVKVTGVPIVPATGDDGKPTDQPLLKDGEPVVARDDNGDPVVLSDDDPFNAHTPKPGQPQGVAPDDEVKPDRGGAVKPDDDGLLPDTGSGLSAWLPWGGLLLLVVGTGVAVVTRRRQGEGHHA